MEGLDRGSDLSRVLNSTISGKFCEYLDPQLQEVYRTIFQNQMSQHQSEQEQLQNQLNKQMESLRAHNMEVKKKLE